MTFLYFALVFGCIFGTVTSLHLDKECITKREWKAPWHWSDTSIGVWVPDRPKGELLNIRLGLTEFHHADITFTTEYITASSTEDLNTVERGKDANCTLGEGWQKLTLSRKANYELYLDQCEDAPPISFPGDLLPEFPKWVEVTGSNVTVNCDMDLRAWKVSRTAVSIPLGRSESHRFSVYSVHELLPRFILENHKVELGIGNNGLSTLDYKQPLPPFIQQFISLSCLGNANYSSCEFTLGNSLEPERKVSLDKPLRHLLVQSHLNDESDFYIFLHQDSSVTSNNDSAHEPAVVAAVVLGILVALLLVAAVLYRFRFSMKIQKKPEEKVVREEELRLTTIGQLSRCQSKESLMNAVLEADIGRVRSVSEGSNRLNIEKAHVEACLMRRERLLTHVYENKDKNRLMTNVLKAYNKHLDKVFTAASKGKYRTEIDPLLRRHEMPGTVRDQEGKSILHHIASAKTADQRPLWTHLNVENFMADHMCVPNAVDYEGRTCLHLLAETAITSEKHITWGEEELTVTESWVSLGKLLMKLGCDPRRVDNSGRLPSEIARMNGTIKLSRILRKECEDLLKQEENADEKLAFKNILKAIYENDLQSLKKLCSSSTTLLPLEAKTDPLTEAIRRGHLEAAMILMASGAPLCGLPLISTTPLSAAHSLPQLPTIIPVIMRKEYINRLRYEAKLIQVRSEASDKFRQMIETLAIDVEAEGDKATWKFTDSTDKGRAKEARDLLSTAADLGLSLTCQMLGLESIQLHPLPREPHPVQRAYDKKQMSTLIVLFRDLHMSLFSILDKVDTNTPLYRAVEALEFQQFEHLCEKMRDTSPRNSFVQQLKSAYKGELEGELDNTILSYISRYGLVCLFHKIRSYVPDLDAPVTEISGFTMLQIAALYGRLGMVEYLLFNGANILVRTKQALTALHLAAIKGNKECMRYLQEYMDYLGLPADANLSQNVAKLADGYGKQLKDFRIILLPDEYGLEVMCTVTAYQRTKALLRKKFKELNISSNDRFITFVKERKQKCDDSMSELIEEVKTLLHETSRTNPIFRGNLVPPTDNYDLFATDSLQLYWELDNLACRDFSVSYKEKGGGVFSTRVTFCNKEFVSSFCLKDEFCKAIRETLGRYTVGTQNLWMLYPCYTVTELGVSIYFAWYTDGRTRQIRVLLTPVLKTDFPSYLINRSQHPAAEFLNEADFVYLANKGGDDWALILTQLEHKIFSKLQEQQQLVYRACKLVINLLYSCWWFPREHSRRHSQNWHFFSAGLAILPYRLLMSLFLEEVASTPLEDWESSHFLDRVISTFKRATYESEEGARCPRKEIRLLLDPTNPLQNPVNKLVCAVIEFLEHEKWRREQ